MKPKILITVKGGIITDISTTSEEVEIYVIDRDCEPEPTFTYFNTCGDTILSDSEFEKELFL